MSQDPLSHVILDETGPIFFSDTESETSDLYLSAYLLICIELVTYRTHLIIMKDMTTRSVIQALETLQQLRGALMNVVLDAHKSHISVLADKEHDMQSVLH